MNGKILSVGAWCFVVLTTFLITNVSAQPFAGGEEIERVGFIWEKVKDNIRLKFNPPQKDAETFFRFYAEKINALKLDFYKKMGLAKQDTAMADNLVKETEFSMSSLYETFVETRKNYPSSVEEFSLKTILATNPCDSSGCTNIDFDQGTLNTWYGYYADKDNNCALNTISGITGGALGAVTMACNDPNVRAYYRSLGTPIPSDYQIYITNGGFDAIVPAIPRVSPWATGGHSVMLGDSTEYGYGTAILEKTFLVTPGTADITYQYAVFLQNPSHCFGNQPLFLVAALDGNGDTIPNCGEYNVISGYGIKGYDSITYGGYPVYYRNWTLANVPLKKYIGQCVTIIFEVRDCGQGGHFGYAYVNASCSPYSLITSSPNLCGQDSISLNAPPGAETYAWSGPAKGILSDTTQQTVWVDSAGTYRAITAPVTGAACADTLFITIGKIPGPPPKPSFYTDTLCAGQPTTFFNASTDTATATFYWDFYNIGIYNDSTINPTWTYAAPGVYNVKLHELYNGCGTDTVIKVQVDTSVSGAAYTFSPNNACAPVTVNFAGSAGAATSYYWNYGDPPSKKNDTSSGASGSHLYANPGTYTVTFIAKNGGPCPDTTNQVVTVLAVPKPEITGQDTICSGMLDTLTAITTGSGPFTYLWSNGATTSAIAVPASTTPYTVTVNNICSSHDTAFTVNILTPVAKINAAYDSVCSKEPDTLKGSGGRTYKWSNGNTSSSIVVNPAVATTYTLYAIMGKCVDSTTVTIGMIKAISSPKISANPPSICPHGASALTVTASGAPALAYKWSTGATSSSIMVSDTITTTYTATVYGKCDSVIDSGTVVVIPLPAPLINGTNWKCKGIRDTLTVQDTITGSSGTTYEWSNGKTTTTYYTGGINADSTVYVVAENKLGCAVLDSFNITLRQPPTNVSTSGGTVCSGTCITITAHADSANGTSNTFSWSNGAKSSSTLVCPDSTTTYSLTISNGCITPAKSTVNVYPVTLYACCDTTILEGHTYTGITGDTAFLSANYAKNYKWEPSASLNCNTCKNVIATPTVTTTYTVSGTDSNDCPNTRMITVIVDFPCFDFTVPNIFTPNGDGRNDVFFIETKNLEDYTITIYDRWGKEVYKSNNQYAAWNGDTEGGSKAADGVYYYVISAYCQGTIYSKDGFVQLIR